MKKKNIRGRVALHGIVNARTGMSIYSPYYGWKEINIKEALENELNLGVYVDNDVRQWL